MSLIVVEIPCCDGSPMTGTSKAPNALLVGGLKDVLCQTGMKVEYFGEVGKPFVRANSHSNDAVKKLGDVIGWTNEISKVSSEVAERGLPLFLGGDHSIAAGTIGGLLQSRCNVDTPLYVLWIDAHPDFHTLHTTYTGNLHGVSLAYVCGLGGFEGFPVLSTFLDCENISMMGIRYIDAAEEEALLEQNVELQENFPDDLLLFIKRVAQNKGRLHLSLDVDGIDPLIAPATGTPVPGGINKKQLLELMKIVGESALLSSVDLVEYDPTLDASGGTLKLLLEALGALFDCHARATHQSVGEGG